MKPIEIIISLLVIGTIVYLFAIGLDKDNEVACLKLQDQATQFQAYDTERDTGFYITKSEKEMCDQLGIEVNAYVK